MLFVFRLAGAQDRPLDVLRLHPVADHGGEQIDPFLLDQPPDKRHQRHAGRDRQVQLLLECRLAGRFARGDRLGRVADRQVLVGGRIPLAVVDAVDDAREHVAAVLQHPFQPAAERSGLNLVGVAGADRVEPVGKDQPGFQQVQAAKELHLLPVEILPVESGQQHVPVPEHALVGHVVNRKQRANLLVAGHGPVFDLQIGRHQGRLPIVGVQHLDVEVEQVNRFEDGAAKEDKPLAIVTIVFAGIVLVQALRGRNSGRARPGTPARCCRAAGCAGSCR